MKEPSEVVTLWRCCCDSGDQYNPRWFNDETDEDSVLDRKYRALPAADFDALTARLKRVEEALVFYAEKGNYCRQPVVADTMGANVPRDCPDKDAHARQACAGFAGIMGAPDTMPVIPHDCGLPNSMDDPRVHVVVHCEPKMWGEPPVLEDNGAKARAALDGKEV